MTLLFQGCINAEGILSVGKDHWVLSHDVTSSELSTLEWNLAIEEGNVLSCNSIHVETASEDFSNPIGQNDSNENRQE